MKTTVVNINYELYDVYIGRPSIWGNPFIVGKDGNRNTVIKKYLNYVLMNDKLLSELKYLKGKRLGCFCKPKSCHGDVLVHLLEEGLDESLMHSYIKFNEHL